MSVSKNRLKMNFLKRKTSTSTRMGHVGGQKLRENVLKKNKNVDINEDWARWLAKTKGNAVFESENADVNEDGAYR